MKCAKRYGRGCRCPTCKVEEPLFVEFIGPRERWQHEIEMTIRHFNDAEKERQENARRLLRKEVK